MAEGIAIYFVSTLAPVLFIMVPLLIINKWLNK